MAPNDFEIFFSYGTYIFAMKYLQILTWDMVYSYFMLSDSQLSPMLCVK